MTGSPEVTLSGQGRVCGPPAERAAERRCPRSPGRGEGRQRSAGPLSGITVPWATAHTRSAPSSSITDRSQRQTACRRPAWTTSARAHQGAPARRAQILDRESAGEDRGPQSRGGGEGEGVVRGVGEHAAVHEAVLLQELLPDVDLQRRPAGTERGDARPHQPAERLGIQGFLGRPQIERRTPLPPHPPSPAASPSQSPGLGATSARGRRPHFIHASSYFRYVPSCVARCTHWSTYSRNSSSPRGSA